MSESMPVPHEKVEKWADSFKVVGNPIRLAILVILFASEFLEQKKSLRFKEIRDTLGLEVDEALSYHIRKLKNKGFIKKTPYNDEGFTYHISKKGMEFLSDFGLAETIRQSTLEHRRSEN